MKGQSRKRKKMDWKPTFRTIFTAIGTIILNLISAYIAYLLGW